MDSTSPTLLQQLRKPNQPQAWSRFVDLYTPLLYAWARKLGLQAEDARELVQQVFAVLVEKLPHFEYDPARKNFRGWLRTICLNQWRDQQRKRAARVRTVDTAALDGIADADDGLQQFWEREHHAFLVRQALTVLQELRGEFQEKTLQACWELLVNQRPVSDVARQFQLSDNAVYIAKLRVLRRLRQELGELLA